MYTLSHNTFSTIPKWPTAEIWLFEIFKMAATLNTVPGSSTSWSTDTQTPKLKPNESGFRFLTFYITYIKYIFISDFLTIIFSFISTNL